MERMASAILFLASALLLASRLVSPASSAPEPRAGRIEVVEQTPPAVAEVDTEVDRLRDRITATPDVPRPARDPFSFGRSTEPVRSLARSAETERALIDVRSTPTLPRLVAILSPDDALSPRTAVFVAGDDVAMKSAGDELGPFHVDAVNADAIVLIDRATRDAFTVSLH